MKIGDPSPNGFCIYCGKKLPIWGFCGRYHHFRFWFWRHVSFPLQRWWRAPIACKIGCHKTSKTNIEYDLERRTVGMFCVRCEKKVRTVALDDSGAVPTVMNLLAWSKGKVR